MGGFPTSLGLALVTALTLVSGACNRPTSENIQLWKSTQKGPDRLRDTLADHAVAPALRGEAAVALVDIGRSEEVDTIIASMPAADRADVGKTLAPACEVAMKDPSPERALAFRDALFSLRQGLIGDDQKRADAALLPAIESSLRAGKLQQGRHSVEKMLVAIGPDSGAMLVHVLAEADAPYAPAADLLAKVGDEPARERGAAALIARAPQIKASDKQHPERLYQALGRLGGPSALKFLEGKVTGPDKQEALLATRALGERRDAAVLPFALKVAGDPKADKALRDEMFGVVEGIGGLEAERGLLAIISSDKEGDRPISRLRVGSGRPKSAGHSARAGSISVQRELQEGRRGRSSGEAHRKAGGQRAPRAGEDTRLAIATGAHDGGHGPRTDGSVRRRGRSRQAGRRHGAREGLPGRRDRRQSCHASRSVGEEEVVK